MKIARKAGEIAMMIAVYGALVTLLTLAFDCAVSSGEWIRPNK